MTLLSVQNQEISTYYQHGCFIYLPHNILKLSHNEGKNKAALDLLFLTQISQLQVSKSIWKEDQSEEKRRNFRPAWQTTEYEDQLFRHRYGGVFPICILDKQLGRKPACASSTCLKKV